MEPKNVLVLNLTTNQCVCPEGMKMYASRCIDVSDDDELEGWFVQNLKQKLIAFEA